MFQWEDGRRDCELILPDGKASSPYDLLKSKLKHCVNKNYYPIYVGILTEIILET